MSIDVTALRVQVTSDGITQTTENLNKMTEAAGKAEAKSKTLKQATEQSANANTSANSALEKAMALMQKQLDLLGANTSQRNAYNAALLGANAAQQTAALMIGAEVDAYKRLSSSQTEAIAEKKRLESAAKALAKETEALAAAQAKAQASGNALNASGQRAAEYKKLQEAQAALIAETNKLAAAQKAQEAGNTLNLIGQRANELKKLKQAEAEAAAEATRLAAAQKALEASISSQKLIEQNRQLLLFNQSAKAYAEAHKEAIAMNKAFDAALRNTTNALRSNTTATHQNSVAMAEAHALARGLSGAFGALWVTYGNPAGIAAGVAIGAALKGILTVGMAVEEQLNFVYALSKDLQKVDLKDFLGITSNSVQPISEAANAMRALAQNGLDVQNSLAALPAILNLATVGEMSTTQAAIAATGAMSAFGLSINDVSRVADIFGQTAATSNTSVLAITESMKQASTASSLFKVSIEETAAMLGVLAKINITGSAAGTAFTNMLTGVYEPTKEAQDALKKLGVSAFETNGKIKPMSEVLGDLASATSNLTEEARADLLGKIFTVRGLKAAITAIENLGEFQKKTREAASAQGYLLGVVQKLEDSSTGAFKRMKIVLEENFVLTFADATTNLQRLGIELTNLFKAKVEKNPLTGELEKSDKILANFINNIVLSTTFVVKNLEAVTLLIAGYVALRLAMVANISTMITGAAKATTLTGAFAAWRSASIASATATVAHQVAVDALNARIAAGAVTTEAAILVTTTQTAATNAATASATAFGVAWKSALGVVGILLAAAGAAWLLFADHMSEAEKSAEKLKNTNETVLDSLRRESSSLEDNRKAWERRRLEAEKPLDKRKSDKADIDIATANLNKMKDQLSAMRPSALLAIPGSVVGVGASPKVLLEYYQLKSAIDKAEKSLETLGETQKLSTKNFNETKFEKVANEYENLQQAMVKFATVQVNAQGLPTVTNEQQRALMNVVGSYAIAKDSVNDLNNELTDSQRLSGGMIKEVRDLGKEFDRVNKMAAGPDKIAALNVLDNQLKRLNNSFQGVVKESQSLRVGVKVEVDKSAVNSGFAALVEKQKGMIDAAKKGYNAFAAELAASVKLGYIDELTAIDRSVEAKAQALEKIEGFLNAEANLYKGRADKQKELVTVESAREAARAEFIAFNTASELKREQVAVDAANKVLRAKAASYTEQGQNLKAFDALFEASHKEEIKRLQSVIFASDEVATARAKDAARVALAEIESNRSIGQNTNANRDAVAAFNIEAEATRNVLKGVQTATEGLGIGDMFVAAKDASDRYAASLVSLQDKLVTVTSPKDQNEAIAQMTALAETQRKLWVGVGESISKSLGDAFGNAGKAAGELLLVSVKSAQVEDKLAADKAAAIAATAFEYKVFGASAEEISSAVAQVSIDFANKEKQARLKSYGDMTSAAKGFFKEGTTGYKVLEGAEKAFRAVELANALKNFAVKIGLISAETSAAIAAQAAIVASFLPVAAAFAGVASLFGLFSRGSGLPSTADLQAKQGTGSILGDSSAKTESIANSLSILEKNSGIGLVQSNTMITHLKKVADGIQGLAQLVARTPELSGSNAVGSTSFSGKGVTALGTAAGGLGGAALGTYLGMGFAAIGGPLGLAIGTALGAVLGGGFLGQTLSKVFGGSKSVENTGFTLDRTTVGGVGTTGANVKQFTDIKTDGGWFGRDKLNTELKSLGSDVNSQFTKIITEMSSTIESAASLLGVGGDEFTTRLNNFVVDIGKISLKGLSTEDAQKAISSVFSKLADDMAQFSVKGLETFQNVGEGYFETLARVANNLSQVKDVFAVLGQSITATGIDAVKVSESLIGFAGGLEALTSGTKFLVDNFATDAQKFEPIVTSVNSAMSALGLSGVKTTEQFYNFVSSLNLNDVASQELYGKLLVIAPAFKDAADYADRLANDTVTLTKAQQKALDITTKQRELDIRLMEAQGKSAEALAARRSDEIEGLNKLSPALGATQDAINTALDAAKITEYYKTLQDQIDSLVKASLPLSEQRALELVGLDETATALKNRVFALQDEAAESVKSKAAADALSSTNKGVQDQINTLVNATLSLDQQRNNELLGLDASTIALKLRVFQLQDEATAAVKAKEASDALSSANKGVQEQIDSLINASLPLEKQREKELIGLDASTVALKLRLFALQDEVEASKALIEIAKQQRGLDIQLLEAQGKSELALAETRKDALAALDASLRPTQLAIYAAQDLAKANDLVKVAEEKRTEAISSARNSLSEAYGRESSALKETISKTQEYVNSLKTLRDNLLLGEKSPLDPLKKYQEARRQLDAASPENFAGAAQNFLDASQGYFASSEAYAQDFKLVQDMISRGIGDGERAVNVAVQQLVKLDAQVAGLVNVNNSVITVKDAILALQSAMSSATRATSVAANSPSYNLGVATPPVYQNDNPIAYHNYVTNMHKAQQQKMASEASREKSDKDELIALNKELIVKLASIEKHVAANVVVDIQSAEMMEEKLDTIAANNDAMRRKLAAR